MSIIVLISLTIHTYIYFLICRFFRVSPLSLSLFQSLYLFLSPSFFLSSFIFTYSLVCLLFMFSLFVFYFYFCPHFNCRFAPPLLYPQAVDHPYLVIHSDTQRDKGQDALVLAETNAAARDKDKDKEKFADIKIAAKGGDDEDEVTVSRPHFAEETSCDIPSNLSICHSSVSSSLKFVTYDHQLPSISP